MKRLGYKDKEKYLADDDSGLWVSTVIDLILLEHDRMCLLLVLSLNDVIHESSTIKLIKEQY